MNKTKALIERVKGLWQDCPEINREYGLAEMLEKAIAGLEGFRLDHEHADGLDHIRTTGDNKGWCGYCNGKVRFGFGEAELVLKEIEEIAGRE